MKYSLCVVYFLYQWKREEVLQLVCDLWKVQVPSHLTYQLAPSDIINQSKHLTCCVTPNCTTAQNSSTVWFKTNVRSSD